MTVRNVVEIAIVATVTVSLAGALAYGMKKSEDKWQSFLKEGNCVVVSKVSESLGTSFGMSASGNPVIGVVTVPGKTGYKCDDGVTYYR